MAEKKFSNLKLRHKAIVDNNSATGRANWRWPYYDLMSEVLADDHSVIPPITVSSRSGIKGAGEAILAIHSGGHFFRSSETGLKLSFLPNAGIEVSNFTWDDFGMYRVKVKVEQNGVLISSSRTAVLSPPDVPMLAGGNLVGRVNPKPARDVTTGSLHVQLQCGTFVSTGSRLVTVEWTTPSGQTVPSTSTSKGSFLLNLPNPVLGGRYTCRVQNPSVISRCVKNTSRLKRGASVDVDETQARIQLLEAMASSLQDKNHQLTSQLEKQTELCSNLVANANSEISSLQTQQSFQTAADNQLRSELQQQQKLNIDLKAQLDSLVAENDDVKAKLKSQEDAISAMKTEVDQSGANLQQQTTELLSNYRTLSQEFKDLKTETEDVKAKLKSQEDATSALKSEVNQSSTNLRQQSTEMSNYRGLPDQLKSLKTKFGMSDIKDGATRKGTFEIYACSFCINKLREQRMQDDL
nr:hypothetical protein BaRGS_024476 [Batillaria attramentaria]